MSDIGAALSARGAGSLRAGTNASRLHQLSPSMGASPKLKKEQIAQLENQCQRMIFEKEDKYLETDQKLKEEDQQLLDLEQEVR